jgi:hypothetical protein
MTFFEAMGRTLFLFVVHGYYSLSEGFLDLDKEFGRLRVQP